MLMPTSDNSCETRCGKGDRSEKEGMILRYAPLVKHVARGLSYVLPPVLDEGDILSGGMVGLIRGVERFDPQRGVPFENYAVAHIRGAIFDQFRSLDVLPRSMRDRAKVVNRAIGDLESKLGRPPTDQEISQRLGIAVDSYRKVQSTLSPKILSLDCALEKGEEGEVSSFLLGLADVSAPDPVAIAERRALQEALTEAIASLSDREKLVLSLYYKEDLTQREIAQVMGVSVSRVCQVHAQAVRKLRSRLRQWQKE